MVWFNAGTNETFTESPTATTAKTSTTTTTVEVSANPETSSAQSTGPPITEESSSVKDDIHSSITTSLLKQAYTSTSEVRVSTRKRDVTLKSLPTAATLPTTESSTDENITTITTTSALRTTTMGKHTSQSTTAGIETETENTVAISTTENTENETEPTNLDLVFPTLEDWPSTMNVPSSKQCLNERRTEAVTTELPMREPDQFSCPELNDDDKCHLDTGEVVTSDVVTDTYDELTTDVMTAVTAADVSTSAMTMEPPLVKSYLEAENVIDSFADLTDEQKAAVGHQKENFIVDCQFSGADCDSRYEESCYLVR